jgi:hypothetical protein
VTGEVWTKRSLLWWCGWRRRPTQTTNGSIVLLHDGGGDRSQTVEALDTIIPYLQSQFDLVRL